MTGLRPLQLRRGAWNERLLLLQPGCCAASCSWFSVSIAPSRASAIARGRLRRLLGCWVARDGQSHSVDRLSHRAAKARADASHRRERIGRHVLAYFLHRRFRLRTL